MKKLIPGDLVLAVLGLLLLTAAVLKAHELLTVPVANKDLWSWRPFLIFQVEFELAMGIWLLSGLFRPLAWLASLLCFSSFCCVTLYKALTGAVSCGCFGVVHVNPWITLLVIDLPAVIALGLFRPHPAFAPLLSFLRSLAFTGIGGRESIRHVVAELAKPMPSLPRLAATAVLGLSALGLTTPIPALHVPATVTVTYEVLEPKTWVGKELPILKYIDIGEKLRKGTWLVLLYHHDCPDCQKAIPQYEQMARDLAGNEDFLKIAFVAVPPYGQGLVSENCPCTLGRLPETKEWFVATPAVALLKDGQVTSAWEAESPLFEIVLQRIRQVSEEPEKTRSSVSTQLSANSSSLQEGR
jgi:thiol-disulfide isomerase/thioredoxin